MLNFSARSQQPKIKKVCFWYLLNLKKTESIPSTEMKCPKAEIFTNKITQRGGSGKAILQISIEYFRALSKYYSGKDGSAPF